MTSRRKDAKGHYTLENAFNENGLPRRRVFCQSPKRKKDFVFSDTESLRQTNLGHEPSGKDTGEKTRKGEKASGLPRRKRGFYPNA